jgi:PAS domain S-box-containing protein
MGIERPRRTSLLEAPGGLSLAPDAVLELDADGVVQAANDVAREMFLLGPDDVPGVHVGSLMRDAAPLVEAVGPEGEPLRRNLKLHARRTNGVPFPVEASVRRLTLQDGVRALCVLHELDFGELITEASRYFDIGFESAPIAMAIFNADGEYIRVNDALCAMLGRTADELLGRRDQEYTHPDDRQADVDAAWDVLEGRRTTVQCVKRFVRPDGSVRRVVANLTFLRDDHGRPLNWVGQFQDLTDLDIPT